MADDQPMWGNNRVVAPTHGAAIIAVDLGDNFTIKGHHLSMIKDRQFHGHSRVDPHKHIAEFIKLLEDRVLLKLDWSKENKPKPLRKTVAFAESEEHSPLLEKMEALTTRIDSQFKEIRGDIKEMRDRCTKCGGPYPSSDWEDKPMGGPKEEEANYASRGYQGGY
ncbi:hypothetical protein Tco_0589911 [Tanacetum coccineum]